jgi:hypothetical protein
MVDGGSGEGSDGEERGDGDLSKNSGISPGDDGGDDSGLESALIVKWYGRRDGVGGDGCSWRRSFLPKFEKERDSSLQIPTKQGESPTPAAGRTW